MKLHIKNGRVIDPANQVDQVQDLYIVDGKIAALGSAPAGFSADQTLDARSQLRSEWCQQSAIRAHATDGRWPFRQRSCWWSPEG